VQDPQCELHFSQQIANQTAVTIVRRGKKPSPQLSDFAFDLPRATSELIFKIFPAGLRLGQEGGNGMVNFSMSTSSPGKPISRAKSLNFFFTAAEIAVVVDVVVVMSSTYKGDGDGDGDGLGVGVGVGVGETLGWGAFPLLWVDGDGESHFSESRRPTLEFESAAMNARAAEPLSVFGNTMAQSGSLQSLRSRSFGHTKPPYLAAATTTRERSEYPTPHPEEQALQSVHSPTSQSTRSRGSQVALLGGGRPWNPLRQGPQEKSTLLISHASRFNFAQTSTSNSPQTVGTDAPKRRISSMVKGVPGDIDIRIQRASRRFHRGHSICR
jgi:hypothetical protein